jgi:hypothetical protein
MGAALLGNSVGRAPVVGVHDPPGREVGDDPLDDARRVSAARRPPAEPVVLDRKNQIWQHAACSAIAVECNLMF